MAHSWAIVDLVIDQPVIVQETRVQDASKSTEILGIFYRLLSMIRIRINIHGVVCDGLSECLVEYRAHMGKRSPRSLLVPLCSWFSWSGFFMRLKE